jgi:hypothetical protein
LALKKVPKDKELLLKLENAKKLYVMSELDMYNNEYSRLDFYSLKTIQEFYNKLNNIRKYSNSQNIKDILKFTNKLNIQKQDIHNAIEQIKIDIETSMENNNINLIGKYLNNLKRYDEDIVKTNYYQAILLKIDKYYLRRVKQLLQNEQLIDAKSILLSYIKLNLNANTTKEIKQIIKNYEIIDTLINNAKDFIMDDQLDLALANLKTLLNKKIKNKKLKI